MLGFLGSNSQFWTCAFPILLPNPFSNLQRVYDLWVVDAMDKMDTDHVGFCSRWTRWYRHASKAVPDSRRVYDLPVWWKSCKICSVLQPLREGVEGSRMVSSKVFEMFNSPNLTKLLMICACWKSEDMCTGKENSWTAEPRTQQMFQELRSWCEINCPDLILSIKNSGSTWLERSLEFPCLAWMPPWPRRPHPIIMRRATKMWPCTIFGLTAKLRNHLRSASTAYPRGLVGLPNPEGILWYTIFMIMVLMSYHVLYTKYIYISYCIMTIWDYGWLDKQVNSAYLSVCFLFDFTFIVWTILFAASRWWFTSTQKAPFMIALRTLACGAMPQLARCLKNVARCRQSAIFVPLEWLPYRNLGLALAEDSQFQWFPNNIWCLYILII